MSITRRQFLLGTSAGFILPSYYDKVFTFFENHGEPLIELPRDADTHLYAINIGGGQHEFRLGDLYFEPPAMTFRQFAIKFFGNEKEYLEYRDGEEVDFDQFVDPDTVYDWWPLTEYPAAKAFRLLYELDLGSGFVGDGGVGDFQFIDCPTPGSDYLGVQAGDEITISLLQKRLNELDTGIRIGMA